MVRNISSRCHLSPGRERRRRSWLAYCWPNLRHHLRIASYVTLTPRSNNSSSTSRKLRQNRKYNHTAWLIISTGKRWFLYFVVAGEVSMLRLCHTVGVHDKLTMPPRLPDGVSRSGRSDRGGEQTCGPEHK